MALKWRRISALLAGSAVGKPVAPIKINPYLAHLAYARLNTVKVYHPFHDHAQAIFVHIPKTAGISILKSLFNHETVGHRMLVEFYLADPKKYKSYFKFGVVRSPWDRAVSAYTYLKGGGRNAGDAAFAQRYLSDCDSFANFMVRMANTAFADSVMKGQHFRPQNHFVRGPSGAVELDYIARFESIENDYKTICERIGVEAKRLSQTNASQRKDYREA